VTRTNTPKQHVPIARYSKMGRRLRILIIVENLPVPFDRRVWSEATTLRDHGHSVFVICPKGPWISAVSRDHRWHFDLSASTAARSAGRESLFHQVPGSP
jgi:hypothetical protein